MFKLFFALLCGVGTSFALFTSARACGGGGGGGCGSSGGGRAYGGARAVAATKVTSGGPSLAKVGRTGGHGDPTVAGQNAVTASASAQSKVAKTKTVTSTKAKVAAKVAAPKHEGMEMGEPLGNGQDDMDAMMCPGCMMNMGTEEGRQVPSASSKATGRATRGMAVGRCGC
jgi:hypothetical protein